MRLHLPFSLRKALLFAISTVAATLGSQTADAAVLFDGVGLQTYADFGQNCGRFVAGEVNAMLTEIREREGGIVITYQSDKYEPYVIPLSQGMIDFSSASSTPVDAAVGYGFLATVSHNGVLNPTYTANDVGGQNAVRYSSIDFKRGTNFHMEAATDYKVSRLNKLVTDAQPSEFYSGSNPAEELNGEYLYRTGSGAMELALIDADGVWRHTQELDIPYSFATGGIVVVEWAEPASHQSDHDGNFGIFHHVNPKFAEEIAAQPLPYRVRSGDSGSPSWVYNETTGTYQYISAAQSGGQYFNQDRGDLVWSKYAMESCGERFQLGGGDHSITLNAVTKQEDEIFGVGDNVDISTIPYSGTITYTDAIEGLQERDFIGIQQGKHTWLDLSPIKDQVNWFNYGNAYFNVSKYKTEDKEFSYADLFVTDNLVFEAGDSETYNVKLNADVDLGIGFVQFGKAEGVTTANFKLQSEHLLESAGFAIDEGVTLELDMKATEARMVEWRKAGAGNLTITGEGDTYALLNVGGSGTVSLKRTGGYAAYNVLASSGSTLVIDNLQQVYRDVTLGAGGATLDLNGNSFTWNNSATPDGNGFSSLHLLMEKDIVTNTANKAVTITITDPGTEAFVGAFRDTKEGAINVEYNGASDKEWVMNTVFTNLQNNDASSFTVNQGSVILQGVNTIHGRQVMGKRPVNEFDWHYADAEMNVTVKSGAEFTLGSHARLTGNVTVENGGTFTMTEYTTHQYEYLEGGVNMDNTYDYREYFGLHGDVNLVGADSTFNVQFTPQHYYQDTDSESVYDGKITGSGGMVVDTAGGSLRLTNTGNTFSGTKVLTGGTLVAQSLNALGETSSHGWFIKDRGVLVVENAGIDAILPKLLGQYEETTKTGEVLTYYSSGVLALTQDVQSDVAPDLSNYQQLIIGAVGEIQFGKDGTEAELQANNNHEWHLGGGGGNLVVNYRLNNEDGVLVLGNQFTTGTVTLTNTGNHFKRIDLVGGVTFVCKDGRALGEAEVVLKYANRLVGSSEIINSVTGDSEGAILLDNMSGDNVDLSSHGKLSLASSKKTVFTGNINLGKKDTYHFGGGGGHLVLDTELTDGDGIVRNVVVDGQFCRTSYSGDEESNDVGEVIELKQALQISGNLTLQGYDKDRIPGDDPLYVLHNANIVTLQLSAEDALADVDTVYMNDCAFIDINGTKQTLNSLVTPVSWDSYIGAFGVVDYSAEQDGELELHVDIGDEEDHWGDGMLFAYLGTPTLTKTGSGMLMLMNAVESKLFDIREGTVVIGTHEALTSGGITRVATDAVLDVSEVMDGDLVNKTIELNGGTLFVGSDAISGSITATESTGSIVAAYGAANLYATIGARENATLELQGDSFILRADQNNTEGGIIDLQGVTLSLNNASGISIGGTLKVSQDATMANASAAGASHTIDRVDVNGQTLTISNNNQAVRWDINALNGSGTVVMQPGNGASTLHLNGPGSFSGELQVEGGVDGTPGLVLAHDEAAQHATIDLQDNGSMAVNTANAHIGGLNGDATGKVFAYKPEGEGSTPVQGATLTTTGSGQYVYSGAVTAVDGTRINLAMDGEGSQTYSGQVDVQDVSALKGTLNLQGSGIHIAGNVTVARGATLSVGNGLTLGSGQYLCSAGVSGKAGIVDSAVTFNGGGMRFDAGELLDNSNTPALHFGNGVTVGQDQQVVVDFINTSTLSAGSVLTLTSGHAWNTNLLTAEGVDYLEAAFSVQDNILKVSFSQKAGNRIWDGTADRHTWSTEQFGQGRYLDSTDTAVFNDSAQNTNVQVAGEVSAAALLFDNSKGYTVNATEEGILSAAAVTLKGSEEVTLGDGVRITGTANIGAGSTLVLQADETLETGATVTGDGTLVVDADIGMRLDGKVTSIGSVEVRRGTLALGESLSAKDLILNTETLLIATTSSILADNATVHSAGTIEIEILRDDDKILSNAVAAGADGKAGMIEKVGGGTLRVQKSLVVDSVLVWAGSLRVENAKNEPNVVRDFLTTTQRVEVQSGASAYIGGNAFTVATDNIGTEMIVDGGRLELAIAQNTTRTITGDLTINSGTLYKVDGGLIFTGATTLGNSIADQVTLLGSWGKAGTIFDGEVHGSGNVILRRERKDNSVEKFTFNNGDNTFSGRIDATASTQLVAGHKTALAQASAINLQDNSTLVLATGEVHIKSLNGSGSVEFSPADASSSTTLNITDGGTFAGAVEGNISISKSGSGTFALTGESSQFNGDLYVKEGTMSLGSSALGMLGSASSVTVKSGAALQLGGAANVVGPMDIQGSLSMGGDISSRDSVQLAATGSLAGGSHTLEANSLVIEGVGGTNVETAASQTLGAGSSLTMFGDPTMSITLQADAEAMIYVVNNVQDVTLSGESLTINLSGLGQTPQPGQWMGITLGDTASIGTDMLVECVMGDGQKLQGYYLSTTTGDSSNYVYFKTEQIVSKDLVWDHTSNTNWSNDKNDRNWHAPDAAAGSSYFTSGANVQFDAGKNTVTLADNITAGDMVLVSGADVSIVNADEYIQEFANVTIAENARLSFDENCSTTIGGTLALAGTVSNEGYLEIGSATVAAGATGVIAGEGMTILTDTISNAGTVMLDHAELAGVDNAAITGNVVIDGGYLLGSMVLGSEGSTVRVTEKFTISAEADYTVLGNLVLDDLTGVESYYEEGQQDEGNGFYTGFSVEVYEIEPMADDPLTCKGTISYNGQEGVIMYGGFVCMKAADYTTFHVNVDTETPESLTLAREASAAQGKQLNEVHMVADGTKLAVDSTASLPNLRVTSGEGAANLLNGGVAAHTLTVTNLTLDGKLCVGEDVTLKLATQLSGTTPNLANLSNAGGTVSVAMGSSDNVLTMDASSTGSLELRSGYISYRSELGEQALHLAAGTQLWFGENGGTKDDAVFTNDIVLDGNATVRVYGSSDHSSATISGNVTGTDYTLTKTDGDQNLVFSGVVNVGGLTTAGNGNGTIIFNGGEGSIGDIVTNGAARIQFSASANPEAKNVYTFDTFNIAPSNGERWLIVNQNTTVYGTGNDLGNDNIHATINGGWNLYGGGLEVNGTLDLAGVISFDGPGNSSIKGAGIINTTGLNISNGTNTTVQGGVTINITSNTGIKKRAGSNSTLNLADATLTATTVDWELQNSVNSVNLTNASDGTTFEAAQGRTITLTKQMGGSGKLVKAGEGTVLAKGANTYSGGTSVEAGTLVASNAGALGTGAVQIAQGANLVINAAMSNHTANSFNNSGGILTMQDGSSLTMHVTGGTKTFNLGNVVVNGSAGIAANTSSACYNALFNMTSLSSGSNGAEIVLATGAQYSKATVFDLDTNQTAAFNGTITVKQNNTSASAGRPVALNLTIGEDAKAAEILKDSVIKLDSAGNTNALVGLGLNSDVTVKGIDSGTAAAKQHAIFAGKATTDTSTFTSTGDDARTLTIDTAGTDHSTHADVLDKINLVKKGEGTQVFSGDMSQFHGSVDVEAGVLNILNAASVAVKDVTIGANGTLGVYNGGTATADTEHEGTLTIKDAQSLTAKGAGATLNANLVMETGSTLDVHGTEGEGLSMGSAITLNMGMNLSSADFANVTGLMEGERYILFNGVDELTLTGSAYNHFTAPITLEVQVDAADYYNNLARGQYFLVYDGSNVGNVAIFSTVPEPATSTLGLLALAALAARRRRKS